MPGPDTSQLRTAATMRQEGATQAETAQAVGISTRQLQRWEEAGLLDGFETSATGLDVLRATMLRPDLSNRDRISAASALARLESLDGDLDQERPYGGVVNVMLPEWRFQAIPPEEACDDCRRRRKEKIEAERSKNLPPKTCRHPGAHFTFNAYNDPNRPGKFINRRHCGCPL